MIIDISNPEHNPKEVFISFRDWWYDKHTNGRIFWDCNVECWIAYTIGNIYTIFDQNKYYLVDSWVSLGWIRKKNSGYIITQEGEKL
jgi:hypothetical protein